MTIPTRVTLRLIVVSSTKQFYLTLSTALACTALAAAQQVIPRDEIRSVTTAYVPPSQAALRSDVRVVEVPVVVRDSQGHTVAGLTRNDFEVRDEGKKETISAFLVRGSDSTGNDERMPKPPRFLALFFDDLHLPPKAWAASKDAATQFVRTSLAPGDRAVVVATTQTPADHHVFTADGPTLVEQIAGLTPPLAREAAAYSEDSCIRLAPHEAYLIAAHAPGGEQLLQEKTADCTACRHLPFPCKPAEIAFAAARIWQHSRASTISALEMLNRLVDGMAKLPGQRVVMLTSNGFLTFTLERDVDQLMDKARHAGVVINVLDARGVHLSAASAYDQMWDLAAGTGGALFRNRNDLEQGFRDLGKPPETTYVLSFTPSGNTDGRFHKLKVKVSASERYSVEARPGYMALPANNDSTASSASQLDKEVTATDAVADLPVSFAWQQAEGRPGVTLIAHLDVARLHFKPWQDRRTQKITIVAVVLDDHGAFVAGKRSELELSFKEATFAELSKNGLPVAMTIEAPSGNYSVRAVAQDGIESKLAAANDVVRIN